MSLKEDVKERLEKGIETMQEAVDSARRAVREMDSGELPRSPVDAIAKVQHSFAWGSANAYSHFENAMMRVKHYGERHEDAANLLVEKVKELPGGADILGEYDRRRG